MKKLDFSENTYFFLTLAVVAVLVILCSILATEEDKENRIYFEQVNRLSAYVEQGRYQEADVLLSELEKKQPEDYRILWQMGISRYRSHRLAESERYMRQARQVNPLIILEAVYLLQYAQLQADLGKYDVALVYLERFQQQAATEELRKEAADLAILLKKRIQKSTN